MAVDLGARHVQQELTCPSNVYGPDFGAVNSHCAKTGERPRETLLLEQLSGRANQGELSGANADALQSVILRLEPTARAGRSRTSPISRPPSPTTRR